MKKADYSTYNSLFYPRSMAMIGVTTDNVNASWALSSARNDNFKGQFYLVGRRGGEVQGLKVYQSVKDIPGPVDYAWIRVPAKAAVVAVKECVEKGVKLASIYSAGFGESDNEWGYEVEQTILDVSRNSDIKLLGPNCMGVYCPGSGLTYDSGFFPESGPVGAFSQSGGNSYQLIYSAGYRGMRFSKVISYGNALLINEAELMEFFALDEESKIVMAYIEGTRDGKRFFQALKEASRTKPVIILKGGQTEGGSRATLSHTRSLAGSTEIWSNLIKQAGAIQAATIEEWADIGLACLFMKPPKGRKVAIIGWGGGASVENADDCYRAGLTLPVMSTDVISELRKIVPSAGTIVKNPLDVGAIFTGPETMDQAIRIIGQSPDVDALILAIGLQVGGNTALEMNIIQPATKAFIDTAKAINKPVVVVAYAVYTSNANKVALELRDICAEKGVAFYPTVARAATAISKLVGYNEQKVS